MKIRIRPIPKTTSRRLTIEPASVRILSRPMRILDFDIENRPLHWISGDYVSSEITAIAWAWVHEPDHVTCVQLGEVDPIEMLERFREAFNRADLVTGHFIRGHDLPHLNGAMTEYQRPPLMDKWTHDTKLDLLRRSGLSGSQENIAGMLGLEHPKIKMDQTKWRSANRLLPEGLQWSRERVIGDVQQHIEMRRRLLELGYLAPPSLWKGGTAHMATYTP